MKGERVMEVAFKVQGEFITNLAREKCYFEGKFDYAIKLLTECLINDKLSKNEIRNMAIAILDGRAIIKGTYPDKDYGFVYLNEKDNQWDLGKLIIDNFNKLEKDKKEFNELLQKYFFLAEHLSEWEQKSLNRDYKEEYGEVLFEGLTESTISTVSTGNTMLDSFMKRQMMNTEDDYGWLEPNGIFHAVEWGEHQNWADLYIQQNFSEEIYENIDFSYSSNTGLIGAGDYLAMRGWILLHSPSQGIAYPTRSDTCRITKAQKEFLYDYYIARDCEKEANKIWNED
jgi:hypothetical protein